MRSMVEGAAVQPPLRGGPSVTLPAAARHLPIPLRETGRI